MISLVTRALCRRRINIMAKKKFVVVHPKHYMRVDGKMAHIETGAEISMEEKDAKSLLKQGKILAVGASKKVNVGAKAEKPEE